MTVYRLNMEKKRVKSSSKIVVFID